eukprot:CAMPEP_0202901646 /NCGR_PEP_ID=MMETSP1392-20130828/14374_1 /ASSEMBLY_ACC=CAM_ASM_000868 /TAXON_ID=225041 /ORGANISM="Chlamydomonas chlamydogama, Strain SAG 11-48b" /LENGTH=54 /DNA_ID=CAMNT_0049588239 /DNA_START=299 /DNA_END=463 /DNA_ORIENTATION=+
MSAQVPIVKTNMHMEVHASACRGVMEVGQECIRVDNGGGRLHARVTGRVGHAVG